MEDLTAKATLLTPERDQIRDTLAELLSNYDVCISSSRECLLVIHGVADRY